MVNIKHVGIYVKNLELMKKFYSSVLNMKIIQSDYYDSGSFYDQLLGHSNAKVKISKLITDRGIETQTGDMIELIEVIDGFSNDDRPPKISSIGTMHIAFGVSNIFESMDVIQALGGEVVIPPVRRENGNWLAFTKDIEGNWLEIIQNA